MAQKKESPKLIQQRVRIITVINTQMNNGTPKEKIQLVLSTMFRDKKILAFGLSYLDMVMTNKQRTEEANSAKKHIKKKISHYFNPLKYDLRCCIDKLPNEHRVEKISNYFLGTPREYIHTDIIKPAGKQKYIFRVEFSTLLSGKKVNIYSYPDDNDCSNDSDCLSLKPVPLSELIGDGEYLKEGPETLSVILYINEMECMMLSIGLWGNPEFVESLRSNSSDNDRTVPDQMEIIRAFPGWKNFKTRMEEMVVCHQMSSVFEKAGLPQQPLTLHCAVIGNRGSGKTSCVSQMAKLYKSLGLLKSDKVWSTSLSKLSSTSVNGEYENAISAIKEAQGGTLLFENAGELYRNDTQNNYNIELRVVRALIDALTDKEQYSCWMLVLAGDPTNMEYLLSSYPLLRKSLAKPIYMEDFTTDELFEILDDYTRKYNLVLSSDAEKKLRTYIQHQCNHRGTGFGNGWLIQQLFDNRIIPAMHERLRHLDILVTEQMRLVEAEDIPAVNTASYAGTAELDALIGLGKIKTKVQSYLNAVRLANRRMELGLPTNMPRLHMAFLGNPGTGKTTVAEIIGRVFASWGILSNGYVIRTEKSQMIGQYIGETEYKMRKLLECARGNILFIDEAYQLVEGGEKDFGRIVMNSLLTELGKDNLDMVVIIAGYTAPMKRLLESNEGIESRFPNVFNFEDYTVDELVEIGKLQARNQGFTFTEGAIQNLRVIIEEAFEKPSQRFGNGRFISNLLQNEIIATIGARTAKLENPTAEELCTILPEDVVIGKAQKEAVFDETAIDAALARLDALAGLDGVKKAIHNFVQSTRYLHAIGEPYFGNGLLSWRFIGKSGTGKSTVAEIMACILKGMRLIANSHIVEIKGERIFNVSEADCDKVLREAVMKSCNGLIFIDVDDPKFGESRPIFGRDVEQIRLKVQELTVEAGGECALILAELEAPHGNVAEQLSDSGIYEFDHTLVFKDFTPQELYQILCSCLKKFEVTTLTPAAKKHMLDYLNSINNSIGANARLMKLMARTIYQQVILRESGMRQRPATHQVQIADIETFKWRRRKGHVGY